MNLETGEHLPGSFAFEFEYAVDGTITKLDKSQFTEKLIQSVPGVSLLTVYYDEKSNGEKDVSVRATVFSKECSFAGKSCQFAVTHVLELRSSMIHMKDRQL